MIYTTNMLLDKYSSYTNPYDKIRRECLSEKLYKLKRGLYEDDSRVPNHFRSQYIYGPSYVSFEYVLSMHGLIPEYTPSVTCATFGKNKSKIYGTPLGTYIYRDVPKVVFPLEVEAKIESGYSYLIASPEKALCDELYISKQVHSIVDFKSLLFDDLRIDGTLLRNLDSGKLRGLAPMYKASNTNLLIKFLFGGEV